MAEQLELTNNFNIPDPLSIILEQRIGDKKQMNKETQTKTETKDEVAYVKAGWLNVSKSGKALTFKIDDVFYSAPMGGIKDLVEGKTKGIQFSKVVKTT